MSSTGSLTFKMRLHEEKKRKQSDIATVIEDNAGGGVTIPIAGNRKPASDLASSFPVGSPAGWHNPYKQQQQRERVEAAAGEKPVNSSRRP